LRKTIEKIKKVCYTVFSGGVCAFLRGSAAEKRNLNRKKNLTAKRVFVTAGRAKPFPKKKSIQYRDRRSFAVAKERFFCGK